MDFLSPDSIVGNNRLAITDARDRDSRDLDGA